MSTDAINETKPCERCTVAIPSKPEKRMYCPRCRVEVTREQQYASREKARALRPKTAMAVCPECSKGFEYRLARGTARKYCSHKCARRSAERAYRERLQALGTCCVEGCEKAIDRPKEKMCEKHYMLKRRNGVPKRQRSITGRSYRKSGYVNIKIPEHPLANLSGYVAEHRKVAYDVYGGRCPPCHWCGEQLTWEQAVIDHLNEIKDDNDHRNLGVCCNLCNRLRGCLDGFARRLTRLGALRYVALLRKRLDTQLLGCTPVVVMSTSHERVAPGVVSF